MESTFTVWKEAGASPARVPLLGVGSAGWVSLRKPRSVPRGRFARGGCCYQLRGGSGWRLPPSSKRRRIYLTPLPRSKWFASSSNHRSMKASRSWPGSRRSSSNHAACRDAVMLVLAESRAFGRGGVVLSLRRHGFGGGAGFVRASSALPAPPRTLPCTGCGYGPPRLPPPPLRWPRHSKPSSAPLP